MQFGIGHRIGALAIVLLAFACFSSTHASAQPPNIGDLKNEVKDYYTYGGYMQEIAAVDAFAEEYIVSRAKQVKNPALVLDIDETSLSNWDEMHANDFGYFSDGACAFDRGLPAAPCGFKAWVHSQKAKAIAPTLALFNAAKANGVAVFFITGRCEAQRPDTVTNLTNEGYAGWSVLVMRPTCDRIEHTADFKAPERAKIAAHGYTIIANVGDQPSDLERGLAERAFLLPDPFYRIP